VPDCAIDHSRRPGAVPLSSLCAEVVARNEGFLLWLPSPHPLLP
jgi:hypothetical protein